MRKLILEEWLSLDGYAVDKNGTLNFFPSAEKNQFSDATLDSGKLVLFFVKSFSY